MKRFLILSLVMLAVSNMAVSAQGYLSNRTVGAVEVELSVSLVTASNRIETFGRSNPGVGVAAEVRYNFAQAPVDLGLSFSLATFSRSHSARRVWQSIISIVNRCF